MPRREDKRTRDERGLTGRKLAEKDERLDGIEAPGWVTSGRHAENGVDGRALASHPSDESRRAVGGDHVRIDSLRAEHYRTNSVGSGTLKSHGSDDAERAVGQDHIKGTVKNPPQGTPGLRTIGDLLGGGSVLVASANHSHSVSFKLLARAARRGLLVLRGRIRGGRERELEERVRDLEGMVLALCHLAFDDEHETAEERERRMVEDPEYRRAWSERMRLDFGNGPELWIMGGHLAEPHGDLEEAAAMAGELGLGRMRTGSVEKRPIPGPKPASAG